MSDFDTLAIIAARDMITAVGQSVTYRGDADEVSTLAVIDQELDPLGLETVVNDARYVCSLLVEDVGAPHQGDIVTDESGVVWILQEEMSSSSEWVSDWSVTRQ